MMRDRSTAERLGLLARVMEAAGLPFPARRRAPAQPHRWARSVAEAKAIRARARRAKRTARKARNRRAG